MKLNINQWAKEDRPREKLEKHGPEMLSDAELLAILIGSGNTNQTAVDLSRDILESCENNLNTLGKLKINQLEAFNGIGKAKAITIVAACELGKRRQLTAVQERIKFDNSTTIYNFMHPKMQDLDVEEGWCVYLNQAGKMIKAMRLSHGGISSTLFDIRLILKEGLLCNAKWVIMCHNHPSNNTMPSTEDENLTQKARKACEQVDMKLLDHVIVCDGSFYSFHDEGKI